MEMERPLLSTIGAKDFKRTHAVLEGVSRSQILLRLLRLLQFSKDCFPDTSEVSTDCRDLF